MKVWFCKVGAFNNVVLPNGADWPMRKAVREAFLQLTGRHDEFCFSGWGATLTEGELSVVEGRDPVHELIVRESPELLRAELARVKRELAEIKFRMEGLEK